MKENITPEMAGNMLMAYVDNKDFNDRLYEFAQDLCQKAIDEIETKYKIDNYNGDDYEMWYDEYRDDFIKAIFEKFEL